MSDSLAALRREAEDAKDAAMEAVIQYGIAWADPDAEETVQVGGEVVAAIKTALAAAQALARAEERRAIILKLARRAARHDTEATEAGDTEYGRLQQGALQTIKEAMDDIEAGAHLSDPVVLALSPSAPPPETEMRP